MAFNDYKVKYKTLKIYLVGILASRSTNSEIIMKALNRPEEHGLVAQKIDVGGYPSTYVLE